MLFLLSTTLEVTFLVVLPSGYQTACIWIFQHVYFVPKWDIFQNSWCHTIKTNDSAILLICWHKKEQFLRLRQLRLNQEILNFYRQVILSREPPPRHLCIILCIYGTAFIHSFMHVLCICSVTISVFGVNYILPSVLSPLWRRGLVVIQIPSDPSRFSSEQSYEIPQQSKEAPKSTACCLHIKWLSCRPGDQLETSLTASSC